MRTRPSWTIGVSAALGMLGLAVACGIEVDVANKACPCGAGYVCDEPRNVCVLPQDLKAPPEPPPPACDPCPCATSSDCKDPTRPSCSPGKICVECGRAPDTCALGYCNELFQCTAGCKDESDCQKISPGTHCELSRHQCVECVGTTFPCTGAGKACSPAGACVDSCTTQPCAGGKACCQGLCLDTQGDVLNCGACGSACVTTNGTPACTAGACTWTCASGFAHCGTTNSGCETNIRTDLTHCGSCKSTCNDFNAKGLACTAGACTFTTCMDGFDDCDDDRKNGCECTCGAKGQECCPAGRPCTTGDCNPAGKCTQ
jgi:hypothetical protein